MNVTAAIVTHNRLELLKEVVDAIFGQSLVVNNVIIVDNQSSVETVDYLSELKKNSDNIIVYRSEVNLGGAGGFSKATSIFMNDLEDDFIWYMDDDTIPSKEALYNLYKETKEVDAGFYSSVVKWTNGKVMNLPGINKKHWFDNLNNGMLMVDTATFVSLLVSRDKIKFVGIPLAEMFIWGDDLEYTLRLKNTFGQGAYILNSIVTHKTKLFETERSIFTTPETLISRYFYLYRNDLYNALKYRGKLIGVLKFFQINLIAIQTLFKGGEFKLKKFTTLVKASWAGIFFYLKYR